jgi:A/G-specific adenine glycosylase
MPVAASEVVAVRRTILAWYVRGHRDLPWRGTCDPYAVLVSEVMLQQTQASRVADRYPRFMARFPNVAALASASEADVLAEWSGLGYNRRARSLHRAATLVTASGWPPDLAGLQALPGVGAYTARAIGSLAFGWTLGVVDTNVRRWLVRRFGLDPELAGAARPALQRLADALATGSDNQAPHDAASWTHASMELGAVVCRAQKPACGMCPIAMGCPSRGRAGRVPVARQRPFRGSRRAYRGALVRALASAPDHALSHVEAADAVARSAAAGALVDAVDPRFIQAAIEGLEREGLVHLDGENLRLGPNVGREAG